MAVFFSIVLLAWTAMHLYVFWRIASVPAFARVPRVVLELAAFFLWTSYVAGRILARRGFETAAAPLEWIGAHWLGVLFLMTVCLLAADLVSGFGYLLPRLAPALRAYALLAAALLSGIALVQGMRPPVVTRYEVRLRGLPAAQDGTVVVVATDMHVGEMIDDRWLSARVQQIQALRPDLVILAGDIVEGDDGTRELGPIFRRLSAPLGVFAVSGNHEFYAGLESSVRLLESAGVRVLRDQWVELKPGLVLAGVDDLTARRQFAQDGAFVQRALAGRPNPAATIFVSHTPWHVEKARDAGAGLMLSGHTHGGQIWPFAHIVRLTYPFVAGRYDFSGMSLLVCRGTGTWGPRMRLWRPGELLRITLRAG